MKQQKIIRNSKNNTLTYGFLENKFHRDFVEYKASEYFYVFYLFYSQLIESGQKTIKDFYNMSFGDVNQELRLRAIILRKTKEQIKYRRELAKQQEEKDKENRQRELLERLKQGVDVNRPKHKYDQ